MSREVRAILVVLVLGITFFLRGGFVSPPQIARSAAGEIVVGKEGGDQARYSVRTTATISGTSVGYGSTSSFGSDLVSKLGGRATLAYLDTARFRQIAAEQSHTGRCSADYLNACQASGELRHVILLPDSADALRAMRRARLSYGQPFRMSGEWLDFQSATDDGNRLQVSLGPTLFFLVRSIERDD